MATLAPSLRALFNELDDVWPNRDRRTDGWYRDCVWVDHGTDHCPDSYGMVHAIDIDKDGINADLVVRALIKMDLVVRYVIWNRHIWEHKNGWRMDNYTGTSNPHTDHIHVSIEHTFGAQRYTGSFGIMNQIAIEAATGVVDAIIAAPIWDSSAYMTRFSDNILALRNELDATSVVFKGLRK